MPAQHFNQESDLIVALKSYTQADADGVMVKVSRQACDEAAERIAALERDLAAAQESYRNCVKDYNTVVDDNTQLRVELAAAQTDAHDRIADLTEDLADAQGIIGTYRKDYSDLMTENRRVVDERDQARTELAAAQAEIERLNTWAVGYYKEMRGWCLKAEAEAAALRVDAERYRWLRDDCSDDQFEALSGKWKWDELDAAIDQARGTDHD